ncbi:hypothetical protein PF004_g1508 [Phytophthora fragariae]|uniref:Uncharacterized protein n=1 Tax=Phytophthora fragariae TaxID=53985 RepID=A0A6G0PS71_9STRA|nr:hypothetical protein PF004_g1508 [Phytophthora fragariae]
MDASELFTVAHDTLTRTVLRVRDGEQHAAGSTPLGSDAIQAVALLFAITLLPVLVRVRIHYTFCWVGFTVLAHVTESEAALGLATSMGLTIMMGWYSLRALDRTTFMGILQGWFGFLSKYRPFRLLANSVRRAPAAHVRAAHARVLLPAARALLDDSAYPDFLSAVDQIGRRWRFMSDGERRLPHLPTAPQGLLASGVHELVVNCFLQPSANKTA